jgi:PAS domain S-box-containing protein
MDIKRIYRAITRIIRTMAFLPFLFISTAGYSPKDSDSVIVEKLLLSVDKKAPNVSVEKLLDSALLISKKTGNNYLTAQVYKVKGDFYLDIQLYHKSLENYFKAITFYKNYSKKRDVYLEILINIGLDYYYLNNADSLFSSTKELFYNVIQGVENKDYYLQAVYDNMGSYYELKENWASALQYYFLAYETAKKMEDKRLEASELLNIGIIYDYSGDETKAISYYKKALEIGKKYNLDDIVSAATYNIYDYYDTTYTGLEIALQNLEKDKKSGTLYNLAMSYNNIGVIYNNLDSLQKALQYYHTSLDISQKHKFEQIEILVYYNLGELYADTGSIFNFDSAKYYINKGIELAEKLKCQDDKLDFLNLLQELYVSNKNYKNAYKTTLEIEKLQQIVNSKESEKKLIEVKTRYETEHKLKELAKAESYAKQWMFYSIIFSLILILLLLFLWALLKIRKIKNKKLLEQELFFNILIENTEDYFLILSLDKLKIIFANSNFLDEFDNNKKISSIEELYSLLIDESDKFQFKNIIKNIQEGTLFSARFSVWVKNIKNEKKYITGIINNKKNDKTLNGLVMNFWDITKQHNTELLLKKSEKKYHDIFDNFPDIYYKESRTGEILEISPSVKKLLGYTPDEIIGKQAIMFYKNIEERKHLIKLFLQHGEVKDEVLTLIKKDKSNIICSITASPFFDEAGNYIGTEGVLKDITDRIRKQKELEETVNIKNKLFEIIANDLLTPLSAYKNRLDILVENIKSWSKDEIILYISIMKPIIDSTNCLLNNLLSWSRLMRNKVVPSIYSYNLYKIINQSIEFFWYDAKNKNIKLIFKGDKTLNVLTDYYMIDIVLRNLISNAIKFSSEYDTIFISCKKENNKVKVEISNKITEMPDTVLNKLNKETMDLVLISGSKHERGTGLGVVVIKGFLKILNSELVISKNKRGDVSFSFKLPLAS